MSSRAPPTRAPSLQIRRRNEAQKAAANVQRVLDSGVDGDVKKAVTKQLAVWSRRFFEAEVLVANLRYEIADRQSTQQPFLDSAARFVRHFLRVRGFHLLLATLAFSVVMIVLGRMRSSLAKLLQSYCKAAVASAIWSIDWSIWR